MNCQTYIFLDKKAIYLNNQRLFYGPISSEPPNLSMLELNLNPTIYIDREAPVEFPISESELTTWLAN